MFSSSFFFFLELIRTDSSLVEMVWMTGPSWFPALPPLRWQLRSAEKTKQNPIGTSSLFHVIKLEAIFCVC